jgi:hypothetical protein
MPTVVLVETPKFSSPMSEAEARNLSEKEVYQGLIEGTLQCRDPFRVSKSDDGDITSGNGYGVLGLYRCRMTNGTFSIFHVLETR